MKILHKIKHLLKQNTGICDSFYGEDGKLYMSFLCTTCGKREGIHQCDEIIDRELSK